MKFCLLLLLVSNISWGEYRVYQYFVKSKIPTLRDNNAYLQTSTLDPVTFLAYHGGNESIKIDLLRSWKCPGHTGNLVDHCASPATPKENNLENRSGR